jgi:hypothetical protein
MKNRSLRRTKFILLRALALLVVHLSLSDSSSAVGPVVLPSPTASQEAGAEDVAAARAAVEKALQGVPAGDKQACKGALKNVQRTCCSIDAGLIPATPLVPGAVVRDFAYPDCRTGLQRTIRCIDGPSTADQDYVERIISETRKEVRPSAACMQAMQTPDFMACGNIRPENLCDLESAVSGSAHGYVSCQSLERFQRASGGDVCNPWGPFEKIAESLMNDPRRHVIPEDP